MLVTKKLDATKTPSKIFSYTQRSRDFIFNTKQKNLHLTYHSKNNEHAPTECQQHVIVDWGVATAVFFQISIGRALGGARSTEFTESFVIGVLIHD